MNPPSANAQPTFEELVSRYENTAAHNDSLHAALTQAAWADPVLAAHRRHVEASGLGFGDPAFHAMWALLLAAAARKFNRVEALEIGVYKGQVISLWALLARERRLDVHVSALTPLEGRPAPVMNLWTKLRYRLSAGFREQMDNANFYPAEDYESVIRGHFAHHGLSFDAVTLHRGFSTDPQLLRALGDRKYHVVYVDGDHSYEGALADFRNFAGRIHPGGWLVADDAGCALPGTTFWKGHQAVSRAAEALPSLGFRNVLNVGHNRIYERTD